MQVSPVDSSTAALEAVWQGALGMLLMSVIALIVVTMRRAALQANSQKVERSRQELTRCFHAFLNSGVAFTKECLPQIGALHFPLIMRIALDITRSLKGDERYRVVELLTLWGMEPYLHRTAQEGSRGKRIQALTLLGMFRDEPSYQILMSNAPHHDMYIQMAALRGLALRAPRADVPHIIDLVIHAHSDMRNSLMLSDILSLFGEAAVPDLIHLVRSEAVLEVRMAGVMALGAIGSRQAVDVLIECAEEEGPLRARAIASMAHIGDERAAYAIAAQLESDVTEVRLQAAIALGKMKVIGTMPDLAVRLSDRDWWVRFRAAEALHRFGDVGVASLMAMARQDNDAGLIARQVLGELSGGV